jgi:hypothetical protein
MKSRAGLALNGRVAPSGLRATYCGHDGAREIRMYSPYADANATRLRSMGAAIADNLHVSRLYAVPGGWGWTICRECRSLEKMSA